MRRAGAIGSHSINGGLKALPKAGVGGQGGGQNRGRIGEQRQMAAAVAEGRVSFSGQHQVQLAGTASATVNSGSPRSSSPAFGVALRPVSVHFPEGQHFRTRETTTPPENDLGGLRR
ncbi:MAG: hypothetical protein DRJ61_01120 [Acidobacteria bacterium]|nr:MAG: hypothetical protein DRJ61_01120 [Acidobacteriota bacterium]